jgi:glycosyltransferase involved in cell wall biosynthesis
VFYQSKELADVATKLLGMSFDSRLTDRRIILPHGIPMPPCLPQPNTRIRVRRELGIPLEKTVVLTTMRIVREKGIFEFIEAMSKAAKRDPKIIGIAVGTLPAYDQTNMVLRKLDKYPELKSRFHLLPACSPDKVWEYLCAADIFAFPSHREGMPNALLEAMAMGVPSVAFAIPPIVELEAASGGVLLVPPLDTKTLSDAVLRLAASPTERTQIGKIGKQQIMARFMVKQNMARALEHIEQIVRKCRHKKSCDNKITSAFQETNIQ